MEQNKISVEPLPITDYYRLIRGQIEHEDNLMVGRLNWFITSQSFLFSAYAIDVTSLKSGVPFNASDMSDARILLRMVIPLIAIIASILIFFSIWAGVWAMHNLRRLYRQHMDKAAHFDLPPVQGFRSTQGIGLAAPLLLPAMFLAVWLWLLIQAR